MLNNKHNLKSERKANIRRMDLKERIRQKHTHTERIDGQKLCNVIFSCCSLHETKAKKQGKETRRQKRNQNKPKRKKRGKKDNNKRETEKERVKKGEGKKLRRNKGDTDK